MRAFLIVAFCACGRTELEVFEPVAEAAAPPPFEGPCLNGWRPAPIAFRSVEGRAPILYPHGTGIFSLWTEPHPTGHELRGQWLGADGSESTRPFQIDEVTSDNWNAFVGVYGVDGDTLLVGWTKDRRWRMRRLTPGSTGVSLLFDREYRSSETIVMLGGRPYLVDHQAGRVRMLDGPSPELTLGGDIVRTWAEGDDLVVVWRTDDGSVSRLIRLSADLTRTEPDVPLAFDGLLYDAVRCDGELLLVGASEDRRGIRLGMRGVTWRLPVPPPPAWESVTGVRCSGRVLLGFERVYASDRFEGYYAELSFDGEWLVRPELLDNPAINSSGPFFAGAGAKTFAVWHRTRWTGKPVPQGSFGFSRLACR